MKAFFFFINAVYWLWLFIVPILITGIPAFLLYTKSTTNLPFCIGLLLIGAVAGIYFAERVRKTGGFTRFFSNLSETPDLNEKDFK